MLRWEGPLRHSWWGSNRRAGCLWNMVALSTKLCTKGHEWPWIPAPEGTSYISKENYTENNAPCNIACEPPNGQKPKCLPKGKWKMNYDLSIGENITEPLECLQKWGTTWKHNCNIIIEKEKRQNYIANMMSSTKKRKKKKAQGKDINKQQNNTLWLHWWKWK